MQGTAQASSPFACIAVASSTAWHTASEVILPIVKTPLSIASGRSVEVRTETAGKWKKAPSSGTVPESENHTEGILLKFVIVKEAKRFVLYNTIVELKASLLYHFLRTRMTTVKHWHIISTVPFH